MKTYLFLAAASSAGAISRYLLSGASYRIFGTFFPYGTLIVNILGCFVLGLLMQLGLVTDLFSRTTRLVLTVGFLGSFTTFSTFGYETFHYIEEGIWHVALLNVLANVLLGLFGVYLGTVFGRLIIGGV